MDSILTSVKKLLGIAEDYTHFDADLIMDINTALSVLNQIGIGDADGYSISSSEETWDDFVDLTTDPRFSMVKSYVYLKVRKLFDPPLSSSVSSSIDAELAELEWRLFVHGDTES